MSKSKPLVVNASRLKAVEEVDLQLERQSTCRATSECLMTPRAGGNSSLVLATPDSTGAYSLSHGLLTPDMKHFQADSMSAFDESLIPLSQKTDFDAHFADMNNGKLEFGFAQKYQSKPASIHLTL